MVTCCNHQFCYDCFNQYYKKNSNISCPYCRKENIELFNIEVIETDVIETLTLTASTFTPVNLTDTHTKSQWKIYNKTTSVLIYDSGMCNDLVSHTLIFGLGLQAETEYNWQVCYKGNLIAIIISNNTVSISHMLNSYPGSLDLPPYMDNCQ